MGFYIRKSINVGPLRFNLSKSGMGVSAGVKGFRVSSGPRGNYVHVGRGGLYYRQALPASNKSNNRSQRKYTQPQFQTNTKQNTTHAPLEEIESTSVLGMIDLNSRELLDELNEKHKKMKFYPVILITGGILSAVASWSFIGFFATVITAIVAGCFDAWRKTTVIFYELDDEIETLYQILHNSIDNIISCERIWHIEAQGKVYNKKYHAGADKLIRRARTVVTKKSPPYVKTNISVPAIGVGKQTLFFFPDRVLVFESDSVGAISYLNLKIKAYSSNFIEDEGVPKESRIVGKTWRYVNKKGGPDRRFNANPEIPIVEYGYLDFSSNSGLNERICLSRTDRGNAFVQAVKKLAIP